MWYSKSVVLTGNAESCAALFRLFYHLPVHWNSDSLLVKIPSAHQICTGKVGGIKPPSPLDGGRKKTSWVLVKSTKQRFALFDQSVHWVVIYGCSWTYTWMRPAAGLRLFSKCFCLCCSWTFRAKPEPRMPCTDSEWCREPKQWSVRVGSGQVSKLVQPSRSRDQRASPTK